MFTILDVARNTFKETIRNKVLYNILFFALGIILLSVSFGDWSVFARVQVMEDFGLATMSLTGLLLAVFIGVGMLGREISSRTVYGVLTKPIARWHFVLGKFFGLLATLFINYCIMIAFFWIVLTIYDGAPKANIGAAIFLIWIEMGVMISVAILFSTLASPMLSAIFTLAFYVCGHFNDLIGLVYLQKKDELIKSVLHFVYYLLPNLEHFNIRERVVYDLAIPSNYVVLSTLYGSLYIALFLCIACIVFARKDL